MKIFPKSRVSPASVTRTQQRNLFSRDTNSEAPTIRTLTRSQARHKMGVKITWTRELALDMLVTTTRAMREVATEGIARWNILPGSRQKLNAMFGAPMHTPNLLASNMATRLEAGEWFVDWLLEMQEEHPERQFYHATFFDDRQRTKDLATTVDLVGIGKPVRALLRENGIIDWFGIIEFQPYINWTRGSGRDIAPHTHVVFWSDTPLDVEKLAAKLSSSRRFVSETDAPTVTVVHRQGAGEIAHMAAYLFKGPERGANLVGAEYRRSGKVGHYDARMRKDQAVRVMEVLSNILLSELILTSGQAAMRGRSDLFATLDQMRLEGDEWPELTRSAAPGVWRRARRHAHKSQYGAVTVIRSGGPRR